MQTSLFNGSAKLYILALLYGCTKPLKYAATASEHVVFPDCFVPANATIFIMKSP